MEFRLVHNYYSQKIFDDVTIYDTISVINCNHNTEMNTYVVIRNYFIFSFI